METDIQCNKNDNLIIKFAGRLDSNSAPNAEFEFCRHLFSAKKREKITLDLEGTSFICSAGLRVLLGVAKRLKIQNRKLHIQNANELVTDIIKMAGFHLFINMIETHELTNDAQA